MADFILFQQPNGEWAKIAVSLDPGGVATVLTAPTTPLGAAGGYVSGRHYTLGRGNIIANIVPVADRLNLAYFDVFEPLGIASLFLRVAVGGTTSGAKVGIWADLDGRPTGAPLIADNVGVDTTTTGIKTIPGTATLPVGRYWTGAKCTGTVHAFIAWHGSDVRFMSDIGGSTAALTLNNGATNQFTTLHVASAYADALPNLTGASFTEGSAQGMPVIGALVA